MGRHSGPTIWPSGVSKCVLASASRYRLLAARLISARRGKSVTVRRRGRQERWTFCSGTQVFTRTRKSGGRLWGTVAVRQRGVGGRGARALGGGSARQTVKAPAG